MQAVISSWLNLEKTIFKPENETIYGTNGHYSQSTVFKKWKNSAVEKGDRKHKLQ